MPSRWRSIRSGQEIKILKAVWVKAKNKTSVGKLEVESCWLHSAHTNATWLLPRSHLNCFLNLVQLYFRFPHPTPAKAVETIFFSSGKMLASCPFPRPAYIAGPERGYGGWLVGLPSWEQLPILYGYPCPPRSQGVFSCMRYNLGDLALPEKLGAMWLTNIIVFYLIPLVFLACLILDLPIDSSYSTALHAQGIQDGLKPRVGL